MQLKLDLMKASHLFNLLDARHAIGVTERQRYILRVRAIAKATAQAYVESRRRLGFPQADPELIEDAKATLKKNKDSQL